MQDLETRVAAIEAAAQAERARQSDKGRRYAFEWFMRASDKFYWRLTKERIADAEAGMEKKIKRITALAVTSAVIGMAGIGLAVIALMLCRFQ